MSPITEAESKHIHELLRSAQERKAHHEFVIEGPHLLEAALDAVRPDIKLVAFTEEAMERYAPLLIKCQTRKVETKFVNARLSRKLSDTEQPQGIFAVVRIPDKPSIEGELVLGLDAVQDPGNVGTLVRTSAWFGVTSILFGEGTADPYAPKVVRSTQGAIFSVTPELRVDLRRSITELKAKGYHVVGSSLAKGAKSLYSYDRTGKTLLLLGSEAHGLHPELEALCDALVIIPKLGKGESLNVAVSGAILLAELTRKHS